MVFLRKTYLFTLELIHLYVWMSVLFTIVYLAGLPFFGDGTYDLSTPKIWVLVVYPIYGLVGAFKVIWKGSQLNSFAFRTNVPWWEYVLLIPGATLVLYKDFFANKKPDYF